MRPWCAVALVAITSAITSAQSREAIDLTNFVVLGEGLAAGFGNFSLHQEAQLNSFAAVMARQMGAKNFPLPLFQAPGLGEVPGFVSLPARVPGTLQTTVRVPGGPAPTGRRNAQPPFSLFVFNVSVPGMKLADALSRRPVPPLIQAGDAQQTLINMILAFPGMVTGPNRPLWSQAEYARWMNPSFVMVALGYADILDAAARNSAALLPDETAFRTNFAAAVSAVRGPGVPVAVATVPDPLDTAFVSTLDTAANLFGVAGSDLRQIFGLRADDLVTVPGLVAMGSRLLSGTGGPLPDGSVVSAATAEAIRQRVRAINSQIAAVAEQSNAAVCDLFAVFNRARSDGVRANGRLLTADFQGGLYSLSGFYPGATMHTVMANECVGGINRKFGTSYAAAEVDRAALADPVVRLIPMIRKRGVTR